MLRQAEFKAFTKLNNTKSIKEIIEIDEDNYLIQIENEYNSLAEDLPNKDFNINVAIASAITSKARILMSQFKNQPKLKLF